MVFTILCKDKSLVIMYAGHYTVPRKSEKAEIFMIIYWDHTSAMLRESVQTHTLVSKKLKSQISSNIVYMLSQEKM